MSADELSARVAVLESEVGKIAKSIEPVVNDWSRAMELIESTNQQAIRTNGKVRHLQRREIERDAREDERRKLAALEAKKAAEKAATAATRRAERRAWLQPFITGAGVTLITGVGGWLAAHLLG